MGKITEQNKKTTSEEHSARASADNVFISSKHSVEICRLVRYKTTSQAKKILEEVIALKRAVPFKRYKRNVGHKPGMAAGRFPQKAAKEILRLVKAVEANAQFKGLNTADLKITKLIANRASHPVTGGRHRTIARRTNLEIEATETKEEKGKKKEEKRGKREKPGERKGEKKEEREKLGEREKPGERKGEKKEEIKEIKKEGEKKTEEKENINKNKPGEKDSERDKNKMGAAK